MLDNMAEVGTALFFLQEMEFMDVEFGLFNPENLAVQDDDGRVDDNNMISCDPEDKNNGEKPKRKHEYWVRPWVLKREEKIPNTLYDLQSELVELNDVAEFRRMLRMDFHTYNELLSILRPYITKQDTRMRNAIPAGLRLTVALQYYATGQDFVSIARQYRLGVKTVGDIVRNTTAAIITSMKHEYLSTPDTTEKWMEIAEIYERKWNFPNAIGAIDGKHIRINPPTGTGSTFLNFKNYFSIILMAIVDANYEFVYISAGGQGKAGDAGIWRECTFREWLDDGSLNLPQPRCLPGSSSNEPLPYVLVGDDAFRLTETMMKPYSRRQLCEAEEVFNYRLSRARRCSENAFGILVNRFRVFLTAMATKVELSTQVVVCCCILHNFLRRRIGKNFTKLSHEEHLNVVSAHRHSQLANMETGKGGNASELANDIRNKFCDYFSGEGAVPWQINRHH